MCWVPYTLINQMDLCLQSSDSFLANSAKQKIRSENKYLAQASFIVLIE